MPPIRFPIAGIMGAVLFASLGMAALRSGSPVWSSVLFLLTCAVLSLGLVGVACRRASERSWWLGFTIFGWGYLVWAFCLPYSVGVPGAWEIGRRIYSLIEALEGRPQQPASGGFSSGLLNDEYRMFIEIIHCLGCLMSAGIGGMLARAFFPPPVPGMTPEATAPPTDRPARRARRRPTVIGLIGLIAYASAALVGSMSAPGLWAGATVLLVWGLLGLAVLGAAFHRGRRRVRWLGAALFGIGYLMLVARHYDDLTWPQYATNSILNAVRDRLPWIPSERPARTDAITTANFRILKALDQTVPIDFPKETPLEDVLKSIVAATRDPDGRVVPLYVDPVGLQEAEKTMRSPVSLEMHGVPLRTTLHLILRQLGMTYSVVDGLIRIDCESCGDGYHEPAYTDAFLLTGQSLLALLAAALGSVLAPWVIGAGDEARAAS